MLSVVPWLRWGPSDSSVTKTCLKKHINLSLLKCITACRCLLWFPLSILFFEGWPTFSVLAMQQDAVKRPGVRWELKPRKGNAGEMQQSGTKPRANGKNEQHVPNVGWRERRKNRIRT